MFRWLEDRTGCGQFVRDALYFHIPGGARWRYVWGTTLVFAFFTELVTGLFLWMHYSPSTQTAWESVYYVQHEVAGGWLLRGIHHYMAQAMIVLLALHLLQVIVHGAYRAPREVNFWLGLVLMIIVLALGFTGYLLPWDQRGFRASQVGTSIAAATPVVGQYVRSLAIGGSDFGHLTLTRFFALHAGLLPGILILLLVVHVALFRRHGVTVSQPVTKPDGRYWPDQALRDGVACLGVLAIVTCLTVYLDTHLGPPADGTQAFNSARPEWYFLFLFQLLKKVEIVAAGAAGLRLGGLVIPGLLMLVLVLMPFIGRWKLGHRFNVLFMLAVLLGVAGLTADSLYEDLNGTTTKSRDYLAALALGEAEAARAHTLAHQGIPPSGAAAMLRSDTLVAGARLFQRHCASCHAHVDPSNVETNPLVSIPVEKSLAPNLYKVGSRDWMATMLSHEKFVAPTMFGYEDSPFVESDMATWLSDTIDPDDAEQSEAVQATISSLAAMANLSYEQKLNADLDLEAGETAINETLSCIDCHNYEGREFVAVSDDDYAYDAPDLTGYMSREWLLAFLRNPAAAQFYGEKNDRMPAYAAHTDAKLNLLTDTELATIVDWLRRDWPLADNEPVR